MSTPRRPCPRSRGAPTTVTVRASRPRHGRLPAGPVASASRGRDRVASGIAGDREIMEWADLGQAARELAVQVVDDGYDPEMILSIARGGLLVGAALGYALAVKNVYTMNVEYYTGVDERLEVPRILPPAPDFVDLQDARILIADDVADTGQRSRASRLSAPARSARCATRAVAKPHSVVRCDYVWRRIDRWISFPWKDRGGGRRPRARSPRLIARANPWFPREPPPSRRCTPAPVRGLPAGEAGLRPRESSAGSGNDTRLHSALEAR